MINKERAAKVLEKTDAGALLITDPLALNYLTGKLVYPGERFLGLLISEKKEPVLFLNSLFRTDEDLGVRVVYYQDTDDVIGMVA